MKKPVQKKNEDSNQSEESEEEYVLKQRLPENGWFPDSDSSSSSDVETLTTVSSSASTSNAKKDIKVKETKSDKNGFDKELDVCFFDFVILQILHSL